MLLDKLIACQQRDGLSDTALAAKLGVSYATWWKTKEGQMKIGLVMARGIFHLYPELSEDTIFFLGQKVSRITDSETSRTPEKIEASGV